MYQILLSQSSIYLLKAQRTPRWYQNWRHLFAWNLQLNPVPQPHSLSPNPALSEKPPKAQFCIFGSGRGSSHEVASSSRPRLKAHHNWSKAFGGHAPHTCRVFKTLPLDEPRGFSPASSPLPPDLWWGWLEGDLRVLCRNKPSLLLFNLSWSGLLRQQRKLLPEYRNLSQSVLEI